MLDDATSSWPSFPCIAIFAVARPFLMLPTFWRELLVLSPSLLLIHDLHYFYYFSICKPGYSKGSNRQTSFQDYKPGQDPSQYHTS